jgi:hypothetical protein
MSTNEFIVDHGLVIFAYQENEASMRSSQVDYFVQSRNIVEQVVRKVEFQSYDKCCEQLLQFRANGELIGQFYFLIHGKVSSDEMLFYEEEKTVSTVCQDLHDFFYPGNCPAFTFSWIYCGSFYIPDDFGDEIYTRTMGVTSSKAGSVTYRKDGRSHAVTLNIPTQSGGYIHSGLNPEILLDSNVKRYISDLLEKDENATKIEFYVGNMAG